jgi:hypothetical protein
MWTKVGRPVLAGTPVTYTVSLTNNDGSNCGALTFNLPLSMPYGWTATIGSSALTLSPAAIGSASPTVTSPASTPNEIEPIGVPATNSADFVYTASAWANYVIGTFRPLTLNHMILLYHVTETPEEIRFEAYDPNDATGPLVGRWDMIAIRAPRGRVCVCACTRLRKSFLGRRALEAVGAWPPPDPRVDRGPGQGVWRRLRPRLPGTLVRGRCSRRGTVECLARQRSWAHSQERSPRASRVASQS